MNSNMENAIKMAAREWLLKFELEEPTAEERRRFRAWRSADPRHVAAYERFERIWRTSAGLTDLAALEPLQNAPSGKRNWLAAGAALAASVALTFLAVRLDLFSTWTAPSAGQFATRTGQIRTLKLADGSTVELGARSAVTVAFNDEARHVSLTDGEAFFTVARHPQRPFIVTAGDKEVRVLGTAFEVRHRAGGVHVAVTEGAVQLVQAPRVDDRSAAAPIEPVIIRAGQEVKAEIGGATLPALQPLSQPEPASWRHGRLVYVDAPLREVVADANRYSDRPITIADPSVAKLGVSVTYASDRLEAMLRVLERSLPVEIERREDNAVVIKARDSQAE